MIFNKNKSYVTRKLNIADFIKEDKNNLARFPNIFSYKYGRRFNLTKDGRSNISNTNSKHDILTSIDAPEVYIPGENEKLPHNRTYYNFSKQLDDKFNMITCELDNKYLIISNIHNTTTASGNNHTPEIEYEDGTLGVVMYKIENNYLSLKIDIQIKALKNILKP